MKNHKLLNVAKDGVRFMDMNDIVYGLPDLSVYAQGCRFGCENCHSKALNVIDEPSGIVMFQDYVIREIDEAIGTKISLCGLGGDFIFQRDAWFSLCYRSKEKFGDEIRTILFTGTFEEDLNLSEKEWEVTDAVVAGRVRKNNDEFIVKTIMKRVYNPDRTDDFDYYTKLIMVEK